jgi:BASS family bile acid:Na+ symporter
MSELVSTLTNVFTLTFVVTSMFSFGLRLTLQQIIAPLRNGRLVLMALLVNFLILPAAALLLAGLLGLDNDLRIGLILISTVAGAALVPKLAQIAKGNVPFAVALVALLLVSTVIYLPLVLPLLLPGVQVDAMSIAASLSLQILLPLALGLVVDYISKDEADVLLPVLGQVSNVSLALLLALQLGSNLGNVIGLLGTGSILATIFLLAAAMAAGYFLGGSDPATRRTLALASGQRNVAAAFVVATGNFADRPDVLVFLAAAGLIGMVLVMPVAGWLGRRAEAEQPAAGASGRFIPATGGERAAGKDERTWK